MQTLTEQARANLEAIERGLARAPVGATVREPSERPAPAVRPAPTRGVDYAPPARGTYPCKAACGGMSELPGLCVVCAAASARADALAAFEATLESIPKTFRWARPDARDLMSRCHPMGANGLPFNPRDLVLGMADSLLSGRLAYVLWGDTDLGKTSIACAVARCIVEKGADALMMQPPAPADRFAPLPALPLVARVASGIRFVATIDLAPPKDRGQDAEPPAFGLAQRASILILDDGSKESSKADSWADSARALATVEVIAKRWDRGLPTIFTTFLDAEGVGDRYDGGTRRRLFDDKRSRAIQFWRPQNGGRT